MSVLDILASKNLINKKDISAISTEARKRGESVDTVLLNMGLKPEDVLLAKSEYYEMPSRSMANMDVPFNVLEYIPEESATHYKIAPLAVKDGVLEVGMVDPDNIEARDALTFISSKNNIPYKLFLISLADFDKIIGMYKGITGEVTKALSELEVELVPSNEKSTDEKSSGGAEGGQKLEKGETKIIEDAPVTKIVATILRYATEGLASDVHIEHMREKVRVRFRVDGTLVTSLLLPTRIHSAVTARIKILANMRLDEKRKPQDGRFSAKIDGRKIDFRVSTFPTYYGEKVVMRILDQEKGVKKLEDMGFSKDNIALVREAIEKPYGLILISGPTGSGKTTTLYSMLNEIDKEGKNVLSLEDPIEYNMEGISQSQVRPEIGYTFANGLRTTLRQDPDVIMVGEIRDKETAQLAIQAALTGHLVLSTIHTNSAVGVIPRLVDMGVDPYLIAPTLILAIAQRLASVRCPTAGKKTPLEGSLRVIVDKQFEDVPEKFKSKIKIPSDVYMLASSADCPNGTRGRIAVFEGYAMTKELEKTILKDPTEISIMKVVRDQGMLTMREDAMLKAFEGTIPFEEVNKL